MEVSAEINTRTDLRLQLLRHGWTPLPNIEKRPGVEAWQKVQPTEALIKTWGRQRKTLTTGIRLDNGLIALDFDIDDGEVSKLFDALVVEFPALNDAVWRTGGGKKEAWFCRCDETFSRIASPIFKDRHVAERGAMLEVFGGKSPRQFGAFGPHSEGVEYRWYTGDDDKERSPATVPLDDLVTITKKQVFAIVDFTSAWLRDNGFEVLTDANAGETAPARAWLLTDDMIFMTEAGEKTLDELRDWAGGKTSCSMSWLDGDIAKSLTRGLVSIGHYGACVYDTMTATAYHEARFKPPPIGGTAAQREVFKAFCEAEGRPLEPGPRTAKAKMDIVMDRTAHLAAHYAHVPADNSVIQIYNDNPAKGTFSMAGFYALNDAYAQLLKEDDRPPNLKHKLNISPVDVWKKLPNEDPNDGPIKITVCGTAERPDKAYPMYLDDGGDWVKNYWKRFEHVLPTTGPKPAERAALFFDFIERLIPDEGERKWMLDAIAYKTQHPEIPTPAVLLVDEIGRVGKGILFRILRKLMGERNSGTLQPETLLGTGNRAQFEGNWAGKVLHTVEELPSVVDSPQRVQHELYHRIKSLIDPTARVQTLPRKYGRDIEVYICATFWMATNNIDALPIPPEDERIVVLICGERRTKKYYCELVRWLGEADNIAALHHVLAARDLSGFDSTHAMPTAGKTAMVKATRYGSEVSVSEWVEGMEDKLGSRPPFLTAQMVLNDVRGHDPMVFVSQTGTRRVMAALRRLGYRDPMHVDGRRPCRWRIKRLGGGDGERETVLQHVDSAYIVNQSVDPESVKKFIIRLGDVKTGTCDQKIGDLNRLLMSQVRG